MGLAWYLFPVNDKILAAAQELLKKPGADRAKLRQIINGKAKNVDVRWWREENGVAAAQAAAKLEKAFEKKLAAIKAMTDPARNPNAHVRREAEAALARVQAAGPPKAARLTSAPGLEEYDREQARRKAAADRVHVKMDEAIKAARARRDAAMRKAAAVNTTRPKQASAKPVNTTTTKPRPTVNTTTKPRPTVNTTTPKKPRTADRHREPNRDRHRPGYMADYMRRRRAAQRAGR
jgi:hypothetical protein